MSRVRSACIPRGVRFLAAALCVVPAAAWAQEDAPDVDRALQRELEALVASVERAEAPGGVLALAWRGEPFCVRPFGLARLEPPRAVEADTVFYLASVAKHFTAACVLDAAAEGRLDLDGSVRATLPSLPGRLAEITPAQLLHHRSGLDDVYDLAIALDLGREPVSSNAAALALCARAAEPDFVPGTRFCYSNTGYVLLAEILASTTDRSLAEYARARLFEPLGMKSACFGNDGPPERRALGYGRDGEAWRALEVATGLIGPGGMWASVEDLLRWERAAFEGGWGSAATRARLVTAPALAPGSALHPAFGPYAGGAMIGCDHGMRTVRLAGAAFGFGAEVLRYPDQELSVIALWNGELGLDDLAERAAAIVLREEQAASDEAPAESAVGAFDSSRVPRFWRDEDSGVLWVLAARPGRIALNSLADWHIELVPLGPARLAGRGTRTPVEVVLDPPEAPEHMRVHASGALVATCRPLAFPPPAPPELALYAGTYRFEPLEATIELVPEGDGLRLVAHRPIQPGPPFELPPFHFLGDDFFACDAGAELQFEREGGEVVGVRLDANRAQGLWLERR